VPNAKTDNQAYSHWVGFQTEVKLASDLADNGQAVVKWGGAVGAPGNDVISVNPITAEVTLWVSCPSVRNSFFAEFQPLFFQRPASLGWFLMGLLHLWALRCACFLCNFRHTRRHCPCPMRTVLFGLV
jgi:hypothetical protein